MDDTEFLSRVSLFSLTKKSDLERIAKLANRHTFDAGDVIIKEGERDRRLYILISGKVSVFKSYGTRKEKLLRTLDPHPILERSRSSMIWFDRQLWLPSETPKHFA